MTVADLLSRLTSSELAEWMAVYDIDAENEKRRGLEREAKRGLATAKRGSR
jgi:hypothetical protein